LNQYDHDENLYHALRDGRSPPTVQQLLDLECEGSLEGFQFDPEVCRRAFDHYDVDKSGNLDINELMKLAEVGSLRRNFGSRLLVSFPVLQGRNGIFFVVAEALGHVLSPRPQT
jgi:hypothetical protein